MSPSQRGGQTKKIKAKILQKCNLTMMSPTQRGGQTQTKWPIYRRAGNPTNCTETQAYIGGQEYIGGIYLRASIYWRRISEGRQILLTNSTESKTTSWRIWTSKWTKITKTLSYILGWKFIEEKERGLGGNAEKHAFSYFWITLLQCEVYLTCLLSDLKGYILLFWRAFAHSQTFEGRKAMTCSFLFTLYILNALPSNSLLKCYGHWSAHKSEWL